MKKRIYEKISSAKLNVLEKALAKASAFSGGGWWIRTTEVDRQQIYSLSPLATREIPQMELVIGVEPTTC